MKILVKNLLIGIFLTISLLTIASKIKPGNGKNSTGIVWENFQDTIFIKNYVCNKTAYLYSKPNLASRTKIRIPKNVMITTINKSGDFEYGDFDVSSNKTFRGWFLKSDLQIISFAPPKVAH